MLLERVISNEVAQVSPGTLLVGMQSARQNVKVRASSIFCAAMNAINICGAPRIVICIRAGSRRQHRTRAEQARSLACSARTPQHSGFSGGFENGYRSEDEP